MGRTNVARWHGDDFQARHFWLNAASLLDPHSPIMRVAYESGPKAFDDILIEYDPNSAPPDHQGAPIYRRYVQCKWHTTAGTFGYADLVDPHFVNATTHSILQRALHAQSSYTPDGTGCRFELKTNWRIRADDPMLELIGKNTDAINVEKLFEGKTDRSKMGRVRKLWREHLSIDDTALATVARVLAILESPESLMGLRERLDERFAAVGMKRVPAAEANFFYDGLIQTLVSQNRANFDRKSFVDMARQEHILTHPPQTDNALTIGVRSFMHPIDNLEDRSECMFNLVPYFDGRYIRSPEDWQNRLLPELKDFIFEAARTSDHLRLILDAHVSLAFAVGVLLNVKSGKRIEIEQRTGGRRFWSMDDLPIDTAWPSLTIEEEIFDHGGAEVAVAAGLTHDLSPAVSAFVRQHLNQVGRILHCKPEGGPSQQSVRCGRHAWMFSETMAQHLHGLRNQGSLTALVHIFIAAPNGFALFLGQHQQVVGPAVIYEWDFDGRRGGGYSPGLTVPGMTVR